MVYNQQQRQKKLVRNDSDDIQKEYDKLSRQTGPAQIHRRKDLTGLKVDTDESFCFPLRRP